jgi:hypothetical protein
MHPAQKLQHPVFTRRSMLQAGTIGLLGLGVNHLALLRALAGESTSSRAKSVIYIFLSGGLAQHDSFDMKPDAPDNIRGEFKPVATKTPGVRICEHLPMLAQRSEQWGLVRSMTHPWNEHSQGHMIMLSGRTPTPAGFNASMPRPTDWPSIAAIVADALEARSNLPSAAVLPEKIVHNTGRVIPGQFAGLMGAQRDPWFIEASPFDPKAYGAFPAYDFDHQERERTPNRKTFEVPNLSLPEGVTTKRFDERMDLLSKLDAQRASLEKATTARQMDRHYQGAVSLLTSREVRRAFDIAKADPRVLERYGDNSFGWSLLMARRLVDAGVRLVQVNLGNNETWDTHGNAFPHLKDMLFPPTDRAVSALLDDLHESGQLDDTLIVMAGEFGRTPQISHLPKHYKLPGRDHWGAVQTVFVAGGGVRGGRVVGSSDRIGAFPATDPQTPENLAATIYSFLGIPATAHWHDAEERPHAIYYGSPIAALFS